MKNEKLWGGRFAKGTEAVVDDFHSSISFDKRLYAQDIQGSIAHARMLGKQAIIPSEDADAIIRGLEEIARDIQAGKVTFSADAEDIHMNIETLLTQRIGEAGKKLHTGRSRNDQVALDARLYVRGAAKEAIELLKKLGSTLVDIASQHTATILPGYTHLQKAQPITLAHHVMAYVSMFLRDMDRFSDVLRRVDDMPLGAGALAGTTYPLDRNFVAQELGFSRITLNSLDAVSDRDFVLDYLSAASLCMMHLSRYCEELILWNTNEFGFVEMDDGYATGSSIMPQKKNPDVAELIRGKTGRVYGDLMALLTVMKGLPLAYNKDMQEDKEALFDARDTLVKCLDVFTRMIASVTFRTSVMAKGASGGFTNATDLADYLVKKGLPFRETHHISGKLVAYCIGKKCALEDLTLEEMQGISPIFESDVYEAICMKTCVEGRAVPGGPAPQAVLAAIGEAKTRIAGF